MVDTFQSLAVAALALLPGGLYMWAREQRTGRWGVGLADRFLRFVGASALMHALMAPLSYYVYGELVQSGRLARGQPLSWWYWVLVLTYVTLPIMTGRLVGEGVRRSWRWVRSVGETNPAPRSWDYLFARDKLAGWVLIKLKDEAGTWLGGFWAEADDTPLRSYASGYPNPQELFFVEQFAVESGRIVVDEDGSPVALGRGLLVRWDEIAYLEFIEVVEATAEADASIRALNGGQET